MKGRRTTRDATLFSCPLRPAGRFCRDLLVTRRPEFISAFVEKLLTYAIGRGVEYYDAPAVRKIVRETAAKDYKFSAIVQAVVKSEQFQMRRVPQPKPVQSASR